MNNLFVKKGDVIKVVDCDEVYFFTRECGSTYAVLKESKILLNASLNYLSQIVGNNFLRTHKSYVVNIDRIDTIEKYNDRTCALRFKDSKNIAYITKENLNILEEIIVIDYEGFFI